MKDKRINAFNLVYETLARDSKLNALYGKLCGEECPFDLEEVRRAVNDEIDLVMAKMEEDGVSYPANEIRNHLRFYLKDIDSQREAVRQFRQTLATAGELLAKTLIEKEPWQNKLLYYFSRFCGPANRENIQFMQRDLVLESRDMRQAQHNKWFITTALTFRALFGGILPMMADGVMRLIKPVKEAKDIAKKSGD